MSTPYYEDEQVRLFVGDALAVLRSLPSESVQCCVTSPPYWGLRDYGHDGQIGLEPTPEEYVAKLVEVFREVRRVLRDDGTLWLNLGDSYAGSWGAQSRGESLEHTNGPVSLSASQIFAHPRGRKGTGSLERTPGLKAKDLVGIPWRVAFALQADGWWLRSDIIWAKPNPMPESVTDRPTKAHEYVFLLSKAERYFYDAGAIKEPDAGHASGNGFARVDTKNVGYRLSYGGRGQAEQWLPGAGRNKRSVWTLATKPYPEAHFATFPPELPEICIKAGTPPDGVVLDPFAGAGTTLWMAKELGRQAVGIELNPDYAKLIERRVAQHVLAL